jgi:hypothetical protein
MRYFGVIYEKRHKKYQGVKSPAHERELPFFPDGP